MKKLFLILAIYSFLCSPGLYAQQLKLGNYQLEAVNVSAFTEKQMGKKTIKVIKSSAVTKFDEPTFARVKDIEFTNGTIEVMVLSRLLPGAPELARGFIGVAFRINESNSKFESIYIRPANGRAANQLQRNHSIQYFSYPDYDFERFRKETPGQYEAYADMGLEEWIKMKIVVKDNQVKLYLNKNKQPSLIVNDLKHGSSSSGAIGLWVDVGTVGYFSNLKIYKE